VERLGALFGVLLLSPVTPTTLEDIWDTGKSLYHSLLGILGFEKGNAAPKEPIITQCQPPLCDRSHQPLPSNHPLEEDDVTIPDPIAVVRQEIITIVREVMPPPHTHTHIDRVQTDTEDKAKE